MKIDVRVIDKETGRTADKGKAIANALRDLGRAFIIDRTGRCCFDQLNPPIRKMRRDHGIHALIPEQSDQVANRQRHEVGGKLTAR
jgi:hypothetical protein